MEWQILLLTLSDTVEFSNGGCWKFLAEVKSDEPNKTKESIWVILKSEPLLLKTVKAWFKNYQLHVKAKPTLQDVHFSCKKT